MDIRKEAHLSRPNNYGEGYYTKEDSEDFQDYYDEENCYPLKTNSKPCHSFAEKGVSTRTTTTDVLLRPRWLLRAAGTIAVVLAVFMIAFCLGVWLGKTNKEEYPEPGTGIASK